MEVPNMPPSSGVPPNICTNSCSGDTGTRGKKGDGSEGCGVVPARSFSSSANSSLAPRPSPARSLQKEHPTKPRMGRQRGGRRGASRTMRSGSRPNSRGPRRRADSPGNRRRAPAPWTAALRPRRPSGVTGTRSSTGRQDGAARSGEERSVRPSAPERAADGTHPRSGLAARGSRWRGSR